MRLRPIRHWMIGPQALIFVPLLALILLALLILVGLFGHLSALIGLAALLVWLSTLVRRLPARVVRWGRARGRHLWPLGIGRRHSRHSWRLCAITLGLLPFALCAWWAGWRCLARRHPWPGHRRGSTRLLLGGGMLGCGVPRDQPDDEPDHREAEQQDDNTQEGEARVRISLAGEENDPACIGRRRSLGRRG